MFDSDDQTRVYSLGVGEQLMCYLDANYSVRRDMASAVATALSRRHGVTV